VVRLFDIIPGHAKGVYEMKLHINIDQEGFELDVPEQLLVEAQLPFTEMDKEFDRGQQMGRYWIEKPDDFQRCQVVANKLVDAFYREDKRNFYLMAAYILYKMPAAREVVVNTASEIQEINILD
jgi:hypothetical protein